MKNKTLILIGIIMLKSSILFAQMVPEKDTSILFNIIFIENEEINKSILGAVGLCRVDSFFITDLQNDTIRFKYHYPFCTIRPNNLDKIRDAIVKDNKEYFLILRYYLNEYVNIKLPYFPLQHDNTLIISRRKMSDKVIQGYYTLIPDNPDLIPPTIVCKGEIIR